MIFVLPIRTSIRPWRTPWANYALIAANILFFLITYVEAHRAIINGQFVITSHRLWVYNFILHPANWQWFQFISYAFLHGGLWHLIGNMFFLYLFGNNVNDKLGNFWYLVFYIAGAVFSGIGHALISSNPVLGASGAVAAVTGAYLVLFPQTLITVFYWLFYFMDTFEVSALYLIGFKLIFWDNMAGRTGGNIAYNAHLAGYAFGILSILILITTGKISHSQFDLWAMMKRWNLRRQHRSAVTSGYDPFKGQTSKKIKAKEVEKTPAEKQAEEKVNQLRADIGSRMADRNLSAAAQLYLELAQLDPEQVPPQQYLLDIANQLASDSKHAEAANAYEKFLSFYKNYEYIEQVQLMLGLIYCRYLNQSQAAIKYLKAAEKKLTDPGQLKMCKDELAKLQN
ncbi:rhomboid family intramembrane serine protease [Planctomycetota bacterium]